jgi:hypothetical protein
VEKWIDPQIDVLWENVNYIVSRRAPRFVSPPFPFPFPFLALEPLVGSQLFPGNLSIALKSDQRSVQLLFGTRGRHLSWLRAGIDPSRSQIAQLGAPQATFQGLFKGGQATRLILSLSASFLPLRLPRLFSTLSAAAYPPWSGYRSHRG